MNISRILYFTTIFAVALFLMGCPYRSAVPLSDANTKAPDNLIGTWEESGNTDVSVVITRASGNNLKIQKLTKNEGGDPSVEEFTGHLTDINGTLFLNLNTTAEESETPEYYIYKLGKDGEFKILLYEVTENIREQFTSSEDMKKFFVANMGNSYFYTTGEVTYFKTK